MLCVPPSCYVCPWSLRFPYYPRQHQLPSAGAAVLRCAACLPSVPHTAHTGAKPAALVAALQKLCHATTHAPLHCPWINLPCHASCLAAPHRRPLLQVCGLFHPEVEVLPGDMSAAIEGVEDIKLDKWKTLCGLCQIPHGAPIKCAHPGCQAAFHPLCGRRCAAPIKSVHTHQKCAHPQRTHQKCAHPGCQAAFHPLCGRRCAARAGGRAR